MSRAAPFLHRLDVKNVRCIKDVSVALTPLHAFIGPNDSGKSTLLRCVSTLSASFSSHFPSEHVQIVAGSKTEIRGFVGGASALVNEDGNRFIAPLDAKDDVTRALESAQLLRLDPDELAAPSELIPANDRVTLRSPRGAGLASVCDAVYGRDVDGWVELRRQFVELFPTVKSLELSNASTTQKQLGATLADVKKTRITARQMSEGMLYWLAFSVLSYADQPQIFLIEEPENGLHPSRIKDVVDVFRKISEKSQIILATHSPLVINELKPEEVSIVTRTVEQGTIVTPMTATKNFEQRSKIYALGELWLSYADGDLEAELTQPDPIAGASTG